MKTLREAGGYREKAFAKAKLAMAGLITHWPDALDRAYDPNRDTIEGIGKVQWEGTRSKEILAEHGLDDEDCLAPKAHRLYMESDGDTYPKDVYICAEGEGGRVATMHGCNEIAMKRLAKEICNAYNVAKGLR
jgi:hypothetical protein